MPASVRAAFMGNDTWSVPTLERLERSGNVDVVLVVTNPPRPAGRGAKLTATPVADAARRLALPLEEAETTRDEAFAERLRSLAPDVSVVVAYGELLSSDVLNVPLLGSVNVHFSLLPRWRGASPVQHAILAGDPVTGVTVIRMDESLDTGPVLAGLEQAIRSDDDAGSLGARLATIGADVLADVLPDLAEGRVTPVPQTGPVTFAPKLGPADRVIEWLQPAEGLVRRVRAFAPDPGAITSFRGGDLKLLRAEEAASAEVGSGTVEPGSIVDIDREGVVVASGSGPVRLLEVAAPGRRRMPASDWARGVRDLVGDRFGS
jgi:methionyl-tRNA formyltransferase